MENYEHKVTVKNEAGEKIEITVTANLAGLNLDRFVVRGLNDFTANAVKPVRDGDKTAEEFAAGFQEAVEKYSRGETTKREGAAPKVADPVTHSALHTLASALKKAEQGNTKGFTKVQGRVAAPLTKDGKINHLAWAKALQAAGDSAWTKQYEKTKADLEGDI